MAAGPADGKTTDLIEFRDGKLFVRCYAWMRNRGNEPQSLFSIGTSMVTTSAGETSEVECSVVGPIVPGLHFAGEQPYGCLVAISETLVLQITIRPTSSSRSDTMLDPLSYTLSAELIERRNRSTSPAITQPV